MSEASNIRLISWIGITLAVMFILPLVAAKCVPPDFGMAVCILLFYIVNPFYCLIIGILAGNNMRGRWELPIISAVIIQLGTWLFFDMYDPVFLRYTVAYLCIGVLAMLIANYIKRKYYALISIESGKLTAEQKKELIERLTATASEITHIPEQFFTITIKELPDENFGIGGKSIDEIKRNYKR